MKFTGNNCPLCVWPESRIITQRHYELSWGYKLKNRTHVFVTSGIQVWGPPVRTAGASEILIINVTFRNDQ